MHLIIDADPIVYRCGFAAERSEYHLIYWDGSGENQIHFAPDQKQTAGDKMKKWLAANPDVEVMDKQREVYPEREDYALEAVRTQLYSIEKSVREKYGVKEFTDISVILSGPGNYREHIAKRFPYKGNRDSDHKPYWYQSIRNYLTGTWGAAVVSGREADDECSIIAWSYLDASANSSDSLHCSKLSSMPEFCVATIDKDLDQIPGPHYNYLKFVHYDQPFEAAERFFYQQCISGDSTDGIPGCFKLGDTRARRIVESVGLSGRDSSGQLWNAVVAAYKESTKRPGCPYTEGDAAAAALECARLVYLQQKVGELWTPPGEPKQWLEGYGDD